MSLEGLDEDTLDLVSTVVEKRSKTDARYFEAAMKSAIAKARKPQISFEGANVFLDATLGLAVASQLAIKLRALHANRVFDRVEASIFVTPDPACCGSKTHWCAVLSGSLICSAELVMSGGAHGTCIRYKSALATKRHVWISPGFQHVNPEKYAILTRKLEGSKWQRLLDKASALERSLGRNSRKWDVIFLVSAAEQANDIDIRPVFCKLTAKDALTCFSTPDVNSCRIGVCGM